MLMKPFLCLVRARRILINIYPANLCLTVVQNGLDREEGIHSSRWAHQNPEVSVPSQDKGEDVQNSGLTPVTRRAVNFSFSAEQADKLREATEKFASLKSGFLSGMAA